MAGMKEALAPETTGFDPLRLIEAHQTGVWRYLRALGCDPSLADDLTQDTFLAVFQKPFQDYDRAATAAYLRKVAYNLLVSLQRRSGKVIAVDNVEQFDNTWARWMGEDNGEERLQALRQCLAKLTARARQALEMRFRQRASRTEIGDALNITEHGAKNLMQRAKKQLKTCIEGKLQ